MIKCVGHFIHANKNFRRENRHVSHWRDIQIPPDFRHMVIKECNLLGGSEYIENFGVDIRKEYMDGNLFHLMIQQVIISMKINDLMLLFPLN